MPGIFSSSFAMTVCASEFYQTLDIDKLRAGAFTNAIDPDGLRTGWVGLGQLVDTENFFLASVDSRFAGFSYRMDARKPSAAVIRLQLAEKIKKEEMAGNKVGGKLKREYREAIIEKLTAQAEFVPSLTDCVWDAEKGRLFIGSTSEKMVDRILKLFEATFHQEPAPLATDVDMAQVFANIQRNNGQKLGDYSIQPMGSASLKSVDANAELSAVSVHNNMEAVTEAMNRGMLIRKIGLVAAPQEDEEKQIYFTIDDQLLISNLRLPKAEKDDPEEATFLINADICAQAAQLADELGSSNPE